ncbi:hypothetical protein POTOM_053316 [Populus tomentosa]|uniref:Uncharacterized protein n=1 Tax=Populus tomentosa TaxID=118781 RepID=A0A8X8C643_POPTO|nr:hypothetical protein POTOM_053316 [Populus tomentosa]
MSRASHVTEKASLCDRENGERLRDSIGDLLKFTLESHVNQTLEFILGLSKGFCIDLLEEDPNDMSCHVTVQQRVMKNHSFDGVAQYPLYKRLALYHSVKCGALWRTHVKMMFCDEDSNLKYASFFKMLQAESLEKVVPGVKTVEEGIELWRCSKSTGYCRLAMYVINRLIAASCWQNIHAVPQHGAVFGIRVVDGYGAAC